MGLAIRVNVGAEGGFFELFAFGGRGSDLLLEFLKCGGVSLSEFGEGLLRDCAGEARGQSRSEDHLSI